MSMYLISSIYRAQGLLKMRGYFLYHIASLCKALKEHFKISCIDVVEFAPFINQPGIPHAQMEPETSMLTMQILLPLFWNVYKCGMTHFDLKF